MNAQQQVTDLLDQMRACAVSNPQRYERLSDQIEVLVGAHCMPTVSDMFEKFHFTPMQERIVEFLHGHLGKVVRREALLNGIYFDRVDDMPQMKIIDVWMVRIRRKLQGSRWRIDTIRERGYRMVELLT